MDRSTQNTASMSILSPRLASRASMSSSRRSSILPGLKKTSSRFSVSGRSNQSIQVICKTPYHVVESFGVSLPVLVTEALTFADRSAAVSVRISTEGWAWFVCGRRLLIWQYKQLLDAGKQRRPISSQCRELNLPPSDLAHRADLVSVYIADGCQVPSCIAVSPEGMVRYWHSISHEGSSVEDSADLQGQECDSLTNIASLGCVLATTTATIVLVQPHIFGGRHSIACRTLKTPSGWLGGIGRRMSSLIFGGLPTSQVMETKLVRVVAASCVNFGIVEWQVFVLAEHSLQKWILSPGESERLVLELDVGRMVREGFVETIWEASSGNPNELDMWLLDMQPTDNGVMVLAAAVNTQLSPQLHYALGRLAMESVVPPTRFTTFCPLKNTDFYREGDDAELLGYRFLLLGSAAYLYNHKAVVAVSAVTHGEDADTVEFTGFGDRLLGGALSGNVPVFFSKNHGLVSVSPSDFSPHDFLNSSTSLSEAPAPSDMTMSQFSDIGGINISVTDVELEDLAVNKDSIARMKAAFIYYIKNQKNLVQSEPIISELFPAEDEPVIDIDGLLDTVVVQIGKELINDAPVGDPRWAETFQDPDVVRVASSTSLQVLHQLNDKQQALEMFLEFLKDCKLWDRLSSVTARGVVMATPYVFAEYAEKLVAAVALRKLQANPNPVIDQAIKHVIVGQDVRLSYGLGHQDLFYKEVTEVHKGMQSMVRSCVSVVHSDRRPQEVATFLSDTGTVILAVLQDVIKLRQLNEDQFSPSSTLSAGISEYLPWTAAPGKGGLRDSLILLESLLLKHGARAVGEVAVKNQLYDQILNLVDSILDGRQKHLESTRGTEKFEILLQQYEAERHNMIQPFLEDAEYERATVLAEKYCDFQTLVQICELTNNNARLNQYMEKFSEQDFSQFLFGWYIREQKQGRLLERFRGLEKPRAQQQALAQFLGDHPSLSWLQHIFNRDLGPASHVLQGLAREETELLARKKTMVSLAKLSLLASDEDAERKEREAGKLNKELELIMHQEELPERVLSAVGYDVERLRVLTPPELIKLYVCEDNDGADEYTFKKALDLLPHIDDEFERSELRHHVWCQAILRDSWAEDTIEAPLNIVHDLLFFKLVDLCCYIGGTPDEFLPPLERMLEANELGTLRDKCSFKYLLKVGYEHIHRTFMEIC